MTQPRIIAVDRPRMPVALERLSRENPEVFEAFIVFLATLPVQGEVTLTVRHGKLHGIREMRASYGS